MSTLPDRNAVLLAAARICEEEAAKGEPGYGIHLNTAARLRELASRPSRSEKTGDAERDGESVDLVLAEYRAPASPQRTPDTRACMTCGDLACLHREDGCHANESAAGCYVRCQRFVPPPGVLTMTIPAAPQTTPAGAAAPSKEE